MLVYDLPGFVFCVLHDFCVLLLYNPCIGYSPVERFPVYYVTVT